MPHSGRSSPRSSGEALDHGSAPSPRKAQLLYPGGNPSRNREKGSEIKIYFFSHFPGSREPRLGTEEDTLSLRHDRRHDRSLRATRRVCRRTQLRRIRSCRNDISFLRLLMCGTTHRAPGRERCPETLADARYDRCSSACLTTFNTYGVGQLLAVSSLPLALPEAPRTFPKCSNALSCPSQVSTVDLRSLTEDVPHSCRADRLQR